MATEDIASPDRPVTAIAAIADLITFTKKELEADAERQAKLQAASPGELPNESQAGVTLDLSHRYLRALPVEVIALIKGRVERLALSHNPQITIPTQIIQCERMRYLNIRWNQLKFFPPEILGLKNLEILDLSKNRIAEIPEEIKQMTSLKFLAVARNKITRLPLALGEMTKLQKMIFEDNPIEFPPLEALKPDPGKSVVERERELCLQVKAFMKVEAARRASTKSKSLEETEAQTTQETPRPTIRGGRFPIRPREASVDISSENSITSSPDERTGTANPPRSHVRDVSGAGSGVTIRRPSVAPLITSGHATSRSRSETASSAASLRTRRQGYLPPRKPTGDSEMIREASDPGPAELPSANKETHWHDMKPQHNFSGNSIDNHGYTSSEATSPVDGSFHRPAPSRRTASLQRALHGSHAQEQTILKVMQRLFSVFESLNLPFRDAVVPAIEADPTRYQESNIINTSNHVKALGEQLERIEATAQGEVTEAPLTARSVFTVSVRAMKYYSLLIRDLKANAQNMVDVAEAIHVRALMFQLHYVMIELRNICGLLGVKVKRGDGKIASRNSTWSQRTVTPTQPSRISSRRMRGATILRSMAGDNTLRAMPPPMLPVSAQTSRSSTATSTPLTARSGESFSSFGGSTRMPSRTRSNTLRSATDESDNDQQHFERIFLTIKNACDIAANNLPLLRPEILNRKEKAQSDGQSIQARDWDRAYTLYETVMASNSALLKRLKVIRLNDPNVRSQMDFWHLCDRFVMSWAEFLKLIREMHARKIDIGNIRPLLRIVQKPIKELSHIVSHSTLYQQAAGITTNNSGSSSVTSLHTNGHREPSEHHHHPQLLASNLPYPSHVSSASQTSNGYVTPATPLSAALGPAAQATVANSTPSSFGAPREYYPAPPPAPPATARMVHERVDTAMAPSGQSKR